MRISDWSSDVCSSDLRPAFGDRDNRLCARAAVDGRQLILQPRRRVGHSGHAGDGPRGGRLFRRLARADRARGRSEEHTSELQSLMRISYAVFCLKKKKTPQQLRTLSIIQSDKTQLE